MFLTIILVSASLITGGPTQPSRAQMLKLYNENAQLTEQSQQLGKELEATDRKALAATKAIANLHYTRAENKLYLDSLAPKNEIEGKSNN